MAEAIQDRVCKACSAVLIKREKEHKSAFELRSFCNKRCYARKGRSF